jgi:hypothetical protein
MLLIVLMIFAYSVHDGLDHDQDHEHEHEQVFICFPNAKPITCLAWQSRLSAKVSAP